MKWHIQRVRINKGGYDSTGYYFGMGLPVYHVWWDGPTFRDFKEYYVRGEDRQHVKDLILHWHPDATFYR